MLLQLEDLHWADDGTLDFLRHLAEADHDVPLLVLALTRPTLYERRADWGSDAQQRIELSPLDGSTSRLLVGELLKNLNPLPFALCELVSGRGEGNPFYMEELVKMLIDHGAIAIDGSQWTLHPDKLAPTQIPPSLTGALQARLDGLPKRERLALQVQRVFAHEQQPPAHDRLARFERRASLEQVQRPADEAKRRVVRIARLGVLGGAGEEHARLRHVAGQLEMFGRSAEEIAGARAGQPGQPRGGAAVQHALCALEQRAVGDAVQDLVAEAVFANVVQPGLLPRQREPAADQCRQRRRGFRVQRRERLVPEHLADHAGLLQGRRAEQRASLDALQAVADALNDDGRRALAARRRSLFGMRTADYRAQEASARQAMLLAERVGDAASKLEAQRLLADALGALGDHAAGEAIAREGLAEARALGLRRAEGVLLNALSFIASQKDDQVTGLALDLQDLPIWRELGNPQGEAIALANVGGDWLWFGELAQARRYLEDALKLSRAVGARSLECGPRLDLSEVLLRQGDARQALATARAAHELAVDVQAADFEAAALCHIGEAELALGHYPQAAAAFERAESVARAIGIGVELDAMAGRARVALALANVAAAVAVVERLLAASADGGALEGANTRLVLFTCHRVLAAAGDSRAAELLDRAFAAVQSRAATISDGALREGFLANIAEHREIVAAWERAHEGDPQGGAGGASTPDSSSNAPRHEGPRVC